MPWARDFRPKTGGERLLIFLKRCANRLVVFKPVPAAWPKRCRAAARRAPIRFDALEHSPAMDTARRALCPKIASFVSNVGPWKAVGTVREPRPTNLTRPPYGRVGFTAEKSSLVSFVIGSGDKGCCLKSKQLSMSFAARSRSVKAGRLNRVSINFNGEVKSNWV